MARTASRIYVPLDATFFDDDKVIEAGEAAGWLYLNMLARAKQLDTDGVLTTPQMERLHVRNWRQRVKKLTEVGLIEDALGVYGIVGWLKWNESVAARATRLESERIAKAQRAQARAAEREGQR
jgi:hypothetical protein